MILGVRKKFLPRILKSYKELKAAGTVTDDFLEEKKMKKWGRIEIIFISCRS